MPEPVRTAIEDICEAKVIEVEIDLSAAAANMSHLGYVDAPPSAAVASW